MTDPVEFASVTSFHDSFMTEGFCLSLSLLDDAEFSDGDSA